MRKLQFKSLARPGIVYVLESERMDYREHHGAVGDYWYEFDTYGDGETQHTPLINTHQEHMKDWLGSLLQVVAEDPGKCAQLSWNWPSQRSDEEVEFAFTVKHNAADESKLSKQQYYSVNECKVSTSESKRNDRRYERVVEWMDGSVASAYGLLWRDGMSTLERFALFMQVRKYAKETKIWTDQRAAIHLKLVAENDHEAARNLEYLFDAVNDVVRANNLLDWSRRVAKDYQEEVELEQEEKGNEKMTVTAE
jgi:hypothetical protein